MVLDLETFLKVVGTAINRDVAIKQEITLVYLGTSVS